MKISIFDLQAEYLDILREIENNEGVITEAIEERLAVNTSDFKDKAESYRVIIHKFESDNELAELSIKNLQSRINYRNSIVEKMKENLKVAIRLVGIPNKSKTTGNTSYKFEGDGFNVVSSPRDSVEILDLNTITNEFVNFSISGKITPKELNKIKTFVEELNLKTEKVPDKTKIGNAIKTGQTVNGAKINTNYGLTFK